MTALARLEALAARRGWRLRWDIDIDEEFPRRVLTGVDILAGDRVIAGPVCVLGFSGRECRESVAGMVLAAVGVMR